MLDELLKYNNLGNERELNFVLFKALSPDQKLRVSDLIRFCTSNMFSISRSIKGIISLLCFLSIIKIEDDFVWLNQKSFNPKIYSSSNQYFQKTHFYNCLFKKINRLGTQEHLFNQDNLRFSKTKNQFYVKSHLIPFEMFPIRNLLISLKFLEQNQTIPNHFFVNSGFTKYFQETIIDTLNDNEKQRKITLDQLKKNLEKKEEAGKLGELFVLQFEHTRLKGHPNFNNIKRISETFSNAGYDIQSFNDLDSFFNDRFIEVKSFSGDLTFYWSKNEVEKAKQLKDKYFLYLVDRSSMLNANYVPKIIQNPYNKIYNNEIWMKEIESWKITVMG